MSSAVHDVQFMETRRPDCFQRKPCGRNRGSESQGRGSQTPPKYKIIKRIPRRLNPTTPSMSSDDYTEILEDENRKYHVNEKWSEGGIIKSVGVFSTLREAMIAAEESEQDEMPTEYGIKFIPYSRDDMQI